MSLINCPECNKEISDKAISCPNCGYPLNVDSKTDKRPIAPIYPLIIVCITFLLFLIFAHVAPGILGWMLLLTCVAFTIFCIIRAYKSVKAKDSRWGCCLATIVTGAVISLIYTCVGISALVRWLN